jgi:hypothetical protein
VLCDCTTLSQNDMEFLRVRSAKHEVMVAPSEFLTAHVKTADRTVQQLLLRSSHADMMQWMRQHMRVQCDLRWLHTRMKCCCLLCFPKAGCSLLAPAAAEGDYVLIIIQDAAA